MIRRTRGFVEAMQVFDSDDKAALMRVKMQK
jgi:hypothetical protein